MENIDIGGPAMIRAAAKNFNHVAVSVDPADYPELLNQLKVGWLLVAVGWLDGPLGRLG